MTLPGTTPSTPLCGFEGCRNPEPATGGPCWRHLGAVRSSPGGSGGAPGGSRFTSPTAPDPYATKASVVEAWAAFTRAFRDAGDVVSTAGVRSEVVSTIRAAAGLETLRSVLSLDLPDARERDRAARATRDRIAEALRPRPNTITDDDAVELASSSSDAEGRSVEDSSALASYALRVEWELGRLGAVEVDAAGVPYAAPFPDYAAVAWESLRPEVEEEVGLVLSRFREVVHERSGRLPVNPAPIGADLVVEEVPTLETTSESYEEALLLDRVREEEERRAEAVVEERAERVARFGAVGGAIAAAAGRAVANRVLDLDGTRAERRAVEAKETARRESERIRKLRLRELEEHERSRRRARIKRRGF